jgi:hypothetical protein
MSSFLRHHPSPAMVVAVLALVVALGGTGYAAVVLPANSVGAKQLKKKAVTGAKIARNAVTSGKVKNGSLRKTDFAKGQLPAGPTGPAGPAGRTGNTGPQGPAGTARAYAAFQADGAINPTEGTAPVGGSALGLAQGDETAHVANSGVYCFHPSFTPKSAMVTALGDLAFASSTFINAVVTVRTDRGLSGCGADDTVRVRTYVIPSGATYAPPAQTDQPFILWLE